ncbi:MAG: glycerol kinase GlpK [Blastocatellia bacterium]|nr:glycerol kinase GlpK [Blastocatellia bacterium]
MKYVLALDQGTTSSRSIIFDELGRTVAVAQREFTQIFPQSGHVEHDPEELWTSQYETAVEALARADMSASDISAIGITNQRETTLLWNRRTGKPIYNAIVWQDRRTSSLCDDVRASHGNRITELTGLEVDAYFSASKVKWLLDNVAGARELAASGDLAFGTVDTWLVWRLTNGSLHITDVSNASRTMLFDINRLEWSDELLEIWDAPRSILPEVRSSSEVYGEVSIEGPLAGIRVAGIAGDQQAALFGQACFDKGTTKNTYGTGCFMLQNVGTSAVASQNRLLSTVAWQIDGVTEYALEGSVFIGGAVIQWLRDSLGIIEHSADVEALAHSVPDNGGVYFVPAFAGLGSPYWDQDIRGTIVGLTRGTVKAHIARAAIESIAFQTADLLTAMNADSGVQLNELRADGGATVNKMLMQFQADILQIPVVLSQTKETTALGAAYLAGLASGVWMSKSELANQWRIEQIFEPMMSQLEANSIVTRWHDTVQHLLHRKTK